MTNPTQQLEDEIIAKGAAVAPRITPADIEANIACAVYFNAADGFRFGWLTHESGNSEILERQRSILEGMKTRTYSGCCIDIDANVDLPEPLKLLTFCVLVLKNGFTVTGESACASPENFNAEIGRKIAIENAVQKIWPLMGYALRDKLSAK